MIFDDNFKMQKKKSEQKIAMPVTGVTKPTQTSKHYSSKTNLVKLRQVQDKNIYFQMPTIHHNDLTMKSFQQPQEKLLKKMQNKVAKLFQASKDIQFMDQWSLYTKKSQIVNAKTIDFCQLQEFLVKSVLRLVVRLQENGPSNSFNFSKISLGSDIADLKVLLSDGSNAQNYCKTMLLQQKSALALKGDKPSFMRSILQQKNKQQNTSSQVCLLNSLQHQNVLLEKKLELYAQRISDLEATLSMTEYKLNQNDGCKDNMNQLMQTMIMKNKYKYDSEVKAMQVQAMASEVSETKAQIQILNQKIKELDSENTVFRAQNQKFLQYLKYKGLWQLASQQSLGWRLLFEQTKDEVNKLQNKIVMLKDKNKQLLNYFNMSNLANPDQEDDKQDLDKVIKEFKQWLMVISVPKVGNNQGNANSQLGQEKDPSGEVNAKLLRPNFYIFFQAFENTLLMEKNIINIRPVQYTFFLKLRTIFDNIFNSFQLAQSYKQYCSFPQYLVGFLQKYQINPASGKIEFRRKPVQSQEKITFLVNLFNKSLCNTWQCQIFKSFLFQNCYLDQIYFFLDCRNELNGGLASNNVLGGADPISYIKLSKALKVVAKKLAPYQNYIIERVKSILKSKKKVKYGESFIDKYFVLKILLEVYGLEKAKSQRIFQSSFKQKKKKQFVTFGDFHNFMTKNFTFLTSIEVAQLYRQAYTLSSGHLNYKIIHYLCGIKGLFIPLLIAKRLGKGAHEQTLNNDMLLLDIQNNMTKMSTHFEQMAMEKVMHVEHSINDFMRQLQYYKINKSAFYQRVYQQKCNIIRVNTLFQLKASYQGSPSEFVQDSDIQTQMIQLHSLLHHTDTHVHFLTKQKDRRNRATNMLVRNFKIRIQESMLQFQKVNEEQISKLKNRIENSKSATKQNVQPV